MNFKPKEIIEGAVSPYEQYCDGFGSPGASGKNYLLGFVLGIRSVKKELGHGGSHVLDGIYSFDHAEIATAYIGQINMSIVSSFCGLGGLVWGYDVAKADPLRVRHSLAPKAVAQGGKRVQIYSAAPLFEATKRLFGTVDRRRFPLLPGAHVPCAGRVYKTSGPTHTYGALGIGIPKNRDSAACLLMEDSGIVPGGKSSVLANEFKKELLCNVVRSIVKVGENQMVSWKEIFVEGKTDWVEADEMNCVLVAAPYFTLAKKAIPKEGPKDLIGMDLEEWEKNVKRDFLSKT